MIEVLTAIFLDGAISSKIIDLADNLDLTRYRERDENPLYLR